jgi:hypothetical protein
MEDIYIMSFPATSQYTEDDDAYHMIDEGLTVAVFLSKTIEHENQVFSEAHKVLSTSHAGDVECQICLNLRRWHQLQD